MSPAFRSLPSGCAENNREEIKKCGLWKREKQRLAISEWRGGGYRDDFTLSWSGSSKQLQLD